MKRKELTKTFMMILKPLWFPWFIQHYFRVVMVKPALPEPLLFAGLRS